MSFNTNVINLLMLQKFLFSFLLRYFSSILLTNYKSFVLIISSLCSLTKSQQKKCIMKDDINSRCDCPVTSKKRKFTQEFVGIYLFCSHFAHQFFIWS